MPYLFLGERRSKTAMRRNWNWQDGRLAGKTLQEALATLGLCYGQDYLCTNLLDDTGTLQRGVIAHYRACEREGFVLVSLGTKVDVILTHHDVPHLRLIHPAARGSIRATSIYQAHVAAVLSPSLSAVLHGRTVDAHEAYLLIRVRPLWDIVEHAMPNRKDTT